jgi:hypothetical protein
MKHGPQGWGLGDEQKSLTSKIQNVMKCYIGPRISTNPLISSKQRKEIRMGCEDVEWMQLVRDWAQWWVL